MVVDVLIESLNAVNLGGLQGVLFCPRDLDPLGQRVTGLFVALQLRLVRLQIQQSGKKKHTFSYDVDREIVFLKLSLKLCCFDQYTEVVLGKKVLHSL